MRTLQVKVETWISIPIEDDTISCDEIASSVMEAAYLADLLVYGDPIAPTDEEISSSVVISYDSYIMDEDGDTLLCIG